MSNFHSNYNDIHREIVITDFTDEQISFDLKGLLG